MTHKVRRALLVVGLVAFTFMGTVGQAGASDDITILRDSVRRLYLAYFLREPDINGQLYWLSLCERRTSLGAISDAFAASAEFRARYGALGDDAFIRLVYRNVLRRDPDAGGFKFWTQELLLHHATRGQMMVNFAQSAEFIAETRSSTPASADPCTGPLNPLQPSTLPLQPGTLGP